VELVLEAKGLEIDAWLEDYLNATVASAPPGGAGMPTADASSDR
jgi:hypothetical protein